MSDSTAPRPAPASASESQKPGLRDETIAHYLETIFYIEGEGEIARPGRIAEWMGLSAPTVSVTLARLAEGGWIAVAKDRSVALTPHGNDRAAEIVRVHRLLERWLTDVLGMDWASADEEAMRLAEGVSPEVANRLQASIGNPATCPHGNVIPGQEPPYGPLISLATLEAGQVAVVRRISEVAEHDAPELLRHLERVGIMPGATVRLGETDAVLGAISLDVDGSSTALSPEVAASIWAELESR